MWSGSSSFVSSFLPLLLHHWVVRSSFTNWSLELHLAIKMSEWKLGIIESVYRWLMDWHVISDSGGRLVSRHLSFNHHQPRHHSRMWSGSSSFVSSFLPLLLHHWVVRSSFTNWSLELHLAIKMSEWKLGIIYIYIHTHTIQAVKHKSDKPFGIWARCTVAVWLI